MPVQGLDETISLQLNESDLIGLISVLKQRIKSERTRYAMPRQIEKRSVLLEQGKRDQAAYKIERMENLYTRLNTALEQVRRFRPTEGDTR